MAHILYRLDIGGLESVVAEIVNRLPQDRFDHAIISLTEITPFRERLHHPRLSLHALHKKPGKDLLVWFRLWRLLRQLQPHLVHTCNLAAMEAVIPATLAGVKATLHAEHGRDSYDPDGTNPKYLLLRRLLAPFVDGFIPVSQDLEQWLTDEVGVSPAKIHRIINGVALGEGSRLTGRLPLPKAGFAPPRALVIGTVGRMWPIKDHLTLVAAFARLRQLAPDREVRLVMVGDGPQRTLVEQRIAQLDLGERVWITGWRADVRELLLGMDLFVLSSLAEGTPLTILEAMAAALPVVATRVGGVPDLVIPRQTGTLVPPDDPEAMARAMALYLDATLAATQGAAGRERVERHFSMEGMVAAYRRLFEETWLRKCM
ncbi:MAG: TIGR03088 family PEP-CTERM/XrtA system glycosyltransferase [Magnetococcales bacterium]|nr:TIGR03088 family PEP-CTERM/XrtA system glycosyltransferase [Magnetococcales bacterium]